METIYYGRYAVGILENLFQDLKPEQLWSEFFDTLYMTFLSLLFSVIIGLIIGVLLYVTRTGGLRENPYVSKVIDFIINILRAVPFIILMFLVVPLAKLLTGSMLGKEAAVPSLVIAASAFYARVCVIAFQEVDKGTIEAAKSMGASNVQIIFKVLLPESTPALVSGATLTAVSLISYTAMAGAIGAGGLGNLAYLYGWARRNDAVLYVATALIVGIVLAVQGLGDLVTKKLDKR